MNSKFKADLSGVTFYSDNQQIIGGFYKAEGNTPGPTAIFIHGLPGVEKHLDVAYRLRDLGWNCLYFHFRGCWGSKGNYTLAGLTEDCKVALDWVTLQECVDVNKIILIAGSTGSHPAITLGATDNRIRAIIGISPVVEPGAFKFPIQMADTFAKMLTGISGEQMVKEWNDLPSLKEAIQGFSPRPMLLIAAGDDEIFPLSDYGHTIEGFSTIEAIERKNADHGFSNCRVWLVDTICDWIAKKMN